LFFVLLGLAGSLVGLRRKRIVTARAETSGTVGTSVTEVTGAGSGRGTNTGSVVGALVGAGGTATGFAFVAGITLTVAILLVASSTAGAFFTGATAGVEAVGARSDGAVSISVVRVTHTFVVTSTSSMSGTGIGAVGQDIGHTEKGAQGNQHHVGIHWVSS